MFYRTAALSATGPAGPAGPAAEPGRLAAVAGPVLPAGIR